METIFYIGLIISGLLGLLIKRYYFKYNKLDTIIGVIEFSIYGFFITLGIWLIIGFIINEKYNKTITYKTNKRYMVAMSDEQSTKFNGRFFLGVANISGGGMSYFVYEEIGKNKYKQISFSPDETIIFEDVDSLNKSYFIDIRQKNDTIIYNKLLKYEEWFVGPMQINEHNRWEIHIPKGSIKHNINLDLE